MKSGFFSAKNLTTLALLSAVVVALQVWGGTFKIGATSLSFVLLPIVLGAVLLGPKGGAFLGFVFGVVTLFYGIVGADFFTALIFSEHPLMTTVLCLGKGTCAGALSGLCYKLLKKNEPVAVTLSSALCPIVNTGLFILGALVMSGTLSAHAAELGFEGESVLYFLVIGCAGFNFIAEFLINLILAPALLTVIRVVQKRRG